MKQACMNCRFAQGRDDIAMFECRLKAPNGMMDSYGHSKWPLVNDRDWCGEFQAEVKPVPAPLHPPKRQVHPLGPWPEQEEVAREWHREQQRRSERAPMRLIEEQWPRPTSASQYVHVPRCEFSGGN